MCGCAHHRVAHERHGADLQAQRQPERVVRIVPYVHRLMLPEMERIDLDSRDPDIEVAAVTPARGAAQPEPGSTASRSPSATPEATPARPSENRPHTAPVSPPAALTNGPGTPTTVGPTISPPAQTRAPGGPAPTRKSGRGVGCSDPCCVPARRRPPRLHTGRARGPPQLGGHRLARGGTGLPRVILRTPSRTRRARASSAAVATTRRRARFASPTAIITREPAPEPHTTAFAGAAGISAETPAGLPADIDPGSDARLRKT